MKQILFKIMSYTLALVLCCIILLQSFQLSSRYKKTFLRNNLKIEASTANLSFLSSETKFDASVILWIKNNLKICNNTSSESEENEEEETKEVELDELCCLHWQIQIILANKNATRYDILSTKLPAPFLFQSSPPPEA